MKKFPILGGKNGTLKCDCGKLRYAGHSLCPDCYGAENQNKGTRDKRGIVIQAYLPKDLWKAVNFAAKMIRNGMMHTKAIKIASHYYSVKYEHVQSGLSQRSGRMKRKGEK